MYKDEILSYLNEIDNCLNDDLIDVEKEIGEYKAQNLAPEIEDLLTRTNLENIRQDLKTIKIRIEKAYI